jgi:tetratricopeptide (TPR) repeat protein
LAIALGLLMVLAVGAVPACADDPADERPAAQREQLGREAARLNAQATQSYTAGRYAEAARSLEQVLTMRQRLYPRERYPQGHPDLAQSFNNLGFVLKAQGEYAKAENYLQQALRMCQGLYPREQYPQGHPDLAQCLNNLGLLLQAQGRYGEALDYFRQALDMYQQLYPKERYPPGHPVLASTLNNLGFLLQAQGEYAKALPYFEQALAMRQQLYPKSIFPQGHPDLAASLNNLGSLLEAQEEYAKALPYFQQALAMRQQLYPKSRYPHGHPQLAISLNNLSVLLEAQGNYAEALNYSRQALEMRREVLGEEHPETSRSYRNLAANLEAQDRYAEAQPLYEKVLAVWRKVLGEGHPDTARSYHDLAANLEAQRRYAEAEPLYRKALALWQKALGEKHPETATGYHDLAANLARQGKYAEAEPAFRMALSIRRKVLGEEHPLTVDSWNHLGVLLEAQGKSGLARDCCRQALQTYQHLARAFTESAPEDEALHFLAGLSASRQGYLSAISEASDVSPADQYAPLWQGKAGITGILARRQQLLRSLADDQTRALAEELLDVRRQLARLLLTPVRIASKDREKRVQEQTEHKERLERDLARRLPDWQRRDALARAPYSDLVRQLPARAAFVDLFRYSHLPRDPEAKPVSHYVAFVLRQGQPVRRADLGPAPPIEQALARWRRDLGDGRGGPAVEQMRRLVWEPLAACLGPDTDSVYLSPDGALHALPWAALPGRQAGSFLLEEYALALVPHGPFLLDQLTAPPRSPDVPDALLAVGDVSYDQEAALQPAIRRWAEPGMDEGKWPALPGTVKELEQVLSLARGAPGRPAVVERRGREACTQQVWLDLPKARWAHLATHGFFAAPPSRERQSLPREVDFLRDLGDTARRRAGALHPLVRTGLVLAGANLPPGPEPLRDDRGILAGEAIAGLDLRRLDLAVLSACDAGPEESAAGEGVFGLQQTFHLGGCRNVVASLWKADDQPTAALLALFYHRLWAEGEPPLQALRHAQLALLRHPDEVPLLAQARGPAFAAAVKRVEAPVPPPGRKATAPEKHWAGFVLSGLGR